MLNGRVSNLKEYDSCMRRVYEFCMRLLYVVIVCGYCMSALYVGIVCDTTCLRVLYVAQYVPGNVCPRYCMSGHDLWSQVYEHTYQAVGGPGRKCGGVTRNSHSGSTW